MYRDLFGYCLKSLAMFLVAMMLVSMCSQLTLGIFDSSKRGTVTKIDGNIINVKTSEELLFFQVEYPSALRFEEQVEVKYFLWGYWGHQIIPFNKSPIPAQLINVESLQSPPQTNN